MRDAIIAAARECLETPFHHQGRRPGVGIDCAGLVIHAYRAAGLRVTDERRYGRSPNPGQMRRALERVVRPVTGEWRRADILYFRIDRQPQHLAIWTGASIVHAYLTAGRVVETGLDGRWMSRLECRYRHVDLFDE